MPPWVEYELTPKGEQLGEALSELERWGTAYMTSPASST